MASVVSLDRDATLNPVAAWPDGFAAWVPELWGTFRGLKSDREVNEMKGGV